MIRRPEKTVEKKRDPLHNINSLFRGAIPMTEQNDDNDKAAPETTKAAVSLPALSEDEIKKLANFTGTIEIPVGQAPQPADPETEKDSEEKTVNSEWDDLENLLWGGIPASEGPVINYGDEYVVEKGAPLADGAKQSSVDDIIAAVRTVSDPEIMMNVYDLGLVYRLDKLANGDVEIDMTVTAPSCPVAGVMPNQVAEAVAALDGTGKVTVKLVWEPAWSVDRMTEEAKVALDLF